MKRLILIVLALILAISVFASCKNEPDKYVSVSSYMLGSPDRDEPTDQEIEERLLASKALFAYKLGKTESRTLQTVYVWDNLLRRELRLDLMQLCQVVVKLVMAHWLNVHLNQLFQAKMNSHTAYV